VPIPREQLRLSPEDLDGLLTSERTARVATVSPDGSPHVVPLWFVWVGGAIWMTSLRKSRRASDLEHGSSVAVCVDTGTDYAELRGAVLYGRFEDATGHPDLARARTALGRKYWQIDEVPDLKSHAWLRLEPDRVVSWDFQKIEAGRDRRMEALRKGSGA
jgi:nitroimidazol reductase NimA-like FMN-containing flavoprotein (pyridoxamine 5'-phosphate oxidase superfamily)